MGKRSVGVAHVVSIDLGCFSNRLLQTIQPPAGEHDVPAIGKQRHGGGFANAAAGTGDDGGLAYDIHQLSIVSAPSSESTGIHVIDDLAAMRRRLARVVAGGRYEQRAEAPPLAIRARVCRTSARGPESHDPRNSTHRSRLSFLLADR